MSKSEISIEAKAESNVKTEDRGFGVDVESSVQKSQDSPAVLQRHVMTPLMSKKVPPVPDISEMKMRPTSWKHPIQFLMFWWMLPIMKKGYKRTLQHADLWKLPERMQVEYLYEQFKIHLDASVKKNQEKAKKKNPDISEEDLLRAGYTALTVPMALIKTMKYRYGISLIIKILYDVGSTLLPLLSKKVISFVEKKAYDKTTPAGKGVGYAIGLSLVIFFSNSAFNHFYNLASMCGVEIKSILTKAVLDKSFSINSKSKQDYSSGKLTSLIGGDLSRIDLAMGFSPFAITFPVPIAIIIVLLIVNLGVSALAGIAVFLAAMMFVGALSYFLIRFRKQATKYTDDRISTIREVLSAIKMIKYYGWETAYHKSIKEIREKESAILFKMQTIRGSFIAVAIYLPTLCSMVAFLVLHALRPGTGAAPIFSSVSLFGLLSTQMMAVPMAVAQLVDAWVAVQRIKDLLCCKDEEGENPEWEKEQEDKTAFEYNEKMAIQVKNAEFVWDVASDPKKEIQTKNKKDKKNKSKKKDEKPEPEPVKKETTNFNGLHDINFDIKKGEFVVVAGVIGSGKSSLLNALAGVMRRTSGVLRVNSSLLLCGYPWVQSGTIRENILFGKPYDAEWYSAVLEACSLNSDLVTFSAGDMTEVGERGITLSGGQKARINLARAVYNDQDIILLDDVLSAVDSGVGKHIMNSCIMGLLKNKTRILVTHQLSLIHHADRVIFLTQNGHVVIGTADELVADYPDFAKMMEYTSGNSTDAQVTKLQRKKSKAKDEDTAAENVDGRLGHDEERAFNKIQWDVYKNYVKAGAGKYSLLVVFFIVFQVAITTFCLIFTNTWLSFWVDNKFKGKSSGFYIGMYLMLAFVGLFLTLAQFVSTTFLFLRSSRNITLKAIRNVFYAPMSLFDTTPMGRIMNRFTKDTDALDNELGDELRTFLLPLGQVVGIVILCIIYIPWVAISIPFVVVVIVCVVSYYQASSREVKRLEAVNRSFVFSNFEECLTGLSTIKSYNMLDTFKLKNDKLLDRMNEAYFVNVNIIGFLGCQFDLVAAVFSAVLTLLCVTGQFNIGAASTGLLVSYLLDAISLLSLMIASMTEVENKMNSAERLLHYVQNLPQEAQYEIPETKPAPEWPESPSIVFDNVSLRYRDNLPLVLRGLSFSVNPGEKVGICGRTGAGKSSLMSAIYRLVELQLGKISIDNIDISTLGLLDLRSKLGIIPQDPVLFKGTIRRNLDPFGERSDDELWNALVKSGVIQKSQLEQVKSQTVSNNDSYSSLHKFHLEQHVEEEGQNFSLGERQLIALTRALVRNSKILILDEATSSVDFETDSNINNVIRTQFDGRTILCIAHRLHTIVKFDKILVMEKGEVEEFGRPIDLFNENGLFTELCHKAGISEKDFAL